MEKEPRPDDEANKPKVEVSAAPDAQQVPVTSADGTDMSIARALTQTLKHTETVDGLPIAPISEDEELLVPRKPEFHEVMAKDRLIVRVSRLRPAREGGVTPEDVIRMSAGQRDAIGIKDSELMHDGIVLVEIFSEEGVFIGELKVQKSFDELITPKAETYDPDAVVLGKALVVSTNRVILRRKKDPLPDGTLIPAPQGLTGNDERMVPVEKKDCGRIEFPDRMIARIKGRCKTDQQKPWIALPHGMRVGLGLKLEDKVAVHSTQGEYLGEFTIVKGSMDYLSRSHKAYDPTAVNLNTTPEQDKILGDDQRVLICAIRKQL